MKKLSKMILHLAALSFAFTMITHGQLEAASAKADQNLKLRIVNFKSCVEKSKLGKQEQSSFEALKKQMETVLGEKEKALNALATKLDDADYLDSLTAEAEANLNREFRTLSQEYNQVQGQYYQVLQQTNLKILDKLADYITKASETIAKKNGYHVVLNDDGTYYYDTDLDISDEIVAVMDDLFEKESKEQPKAAEVKK